MDWTTSDWSLVISIVALGSSILFSFLAYQLSQRSHNLSLEKYKQEQEEKSKRNLNISVSHSSKSEFVPNDHLKWLGIWLILSNRGEEQPLLGDVIVHLTFKQRKAEGLLLFLLKRILKIKDEAHINFPLYSGGWQVNNKGFIYSSRISENFYLINWDTKKPIFFGPQKEYRMPAPGQKEIWYLFGDFPEDEALRWMEQGYELEKTSISFFTDQGKIEVEENMVTYVLSEDLMKENSSYTFDFKPNRNSLFRFRQFD